MNKKKILIFTALYTGILLLIIFNPFTKNKELEGMLLDLVKAAAEEDKPFVEESLIYGHLTNYNTTSDTGYIQFTEQEIKEILEIVATTEVKELDTYKNKLFYKIWDDPEADIHRIDISNRGYTMPYDVELDIKIRTFEEKIVLYLPQIGNFLTEDFRLMEKIQHYYSVPREEK